MKLRIAAIVSILAVIFYFSWLVQVLNTHALWFSLAFFLMNLYTALLLLVAIFNNWNKEVPKLTRLPEGLEPIVAVLIPTWEEPVDMLKVTIESVLHQQWPHEKLVVVIGDDSRRPEVRTMVQSLQRRYASTQLIYHLPPPKGTPQRMGNAKDGNLNSMLHFISVNYPGIKFIETRDADDLVGDAKFLRYAIGHLVGNPNTAYVQTIKDARVSPGDPFGNRQTFFYRELMPSKCASNAVFPCGSGLVWRKEHLDRIGGFPTWNLVEDLYSGFVAMQHGLKNSYIPIIGAVGQIAPEDIPNVYKQLGTWALDTFRLFVWKNPWFAKGLTFKQKMHFTELGLFYLFSLPLFILIITPAISLILETRPLLVDNSSYTIHCLVYATVIEMLFAILGNNVPFAHIWRARQMQVGMMFVYMKACALAIIYGPNRKPAYKVTRKFQKSALYLRETLPQIATCVLLLFSAVYNVVVHWNMFEAIDLGSIFWAGLYIVILYGFIRKSWHGIKWQWPLLPRWGLLPKLQRLTLLRLGYSEQNPPWLVSTSTLPVIQPGSREALWLVETSILPILRLDSVEPVYHLEPLQTPKKQFITLPMTPMPGPASASPTQANRGLFRAYGRDSSRPPMPGPASAFPTQVNRGLLRAYGRDSSRPGWGQASPHSPAASIPSFTTQQEVWLMSTSILPVVTPPPG